jgi:hypothetical protein
MTKNLLLRALEFLTAGLGRRHRRELEEVEVRALEGNDWGAEAQPKRTEFETEKAAKAMTSSEFEWVV